MYVYLHCQLQNYKKVLNFGGCSLFGDSLNLECFLVQWENCLKLLHTNGSRVTYWRLPTYFQWKAFLLQTLKAMKVSKLSITKLQKGPQFWWLFSLWWFTQFGVLLSPIALKVVGPLLLHSNSSRDGTNPPSNSLYGNPQTRKQRDKFTMKITFFSKLNCILSEANSIHLHPQYH